MGEPTGTATGLHALNIAEIVTGLISDLEGLRAGTVTVPQARARAQMAHEIFRGINLVIQGQKIIENRAKPIGPQLMPPKRKGGKA